jgi:multidrug efflux system membrane fusion protein
MASRSTKRLLMGTALVVVLAAAGAATYLAKDSRGKAPPAKGPGKGGGAVPVLVVAAEQQTLPVTVQAIGNVEAFTSVALKARIDGQIVAVNFQEGKEVRKGDILFRIDPRPLEAALKQSEAQALRDMASRDQAASQERRYQELLDKNFVSKDAYAQFRTNAATAEATSRASQAALENAKLSLDYTVIRAPIDGFVGRALLQAGNMVKANDTISLVVINQVKPVYVNFAIPEPQLPVIRDLMKKGPLSVEVAAPGSDKPLAAGRIAFLDNAVDQTTGTIKVRAVFDNADVALWPGQFVNVRVKLYDQHNATVVPSRALQTGPAGQFVYVIKPDMTAEVRKVTVMRTQGEISVLADGALARDEKVVVRGALRLAPGAKVTIADPGAAS